MTTQLNWVRGCRFRAIIKVVEILTTDGLCDFVELFVYYFYLVLSSIELKEFDAFGDTQLTTESCYTTEEATILLSGPAKQRCDKNFIYRATPWLIDLRYTCQRCIYKNRAARKNSLMFCMSTRS